MEFSTSDPVVKDSVQFIREKSSYGQRYPVIKSENGRAIADYLNANIGDGTTLRQKLDVDANCIITANGTSVSETYITKANDIIKFLDKPKTNG